VHVYSPRKVPKGVDLRSAAVKEMVNRKLREAGLKSQLAIIGEIRPFDSWCVDTDVSVKVPFDEIRSISEGYHWSGIEVQPCIIFLRREFEAGSAGMSNHHS
jgi:hypothetical protein